jgi:signal peptidase II
MDARSEDVGRAGPAVPLSRYVVFLALAAGVLAADLATKTWVFARLGMPPNGRTKWIWEGVFALQTSLNEGALFGVWQGSWPLLAALAIGAAVAIVVWLFAAGAARDWLLTVALALINGGILGNLYDRLALPGLVWNGEPVHAVRDFILVMIGRWPWPNFNLADSSLVCGAALLVWHACFTKADGGRHEGDGRGEKAGLC